MRIPCPFCGSRELSEFVYRGEAGGARPDPAAPDAAENFFAYAYLRDNPAGPGAGYWYHAPAAAPGSRSMRDTRTHEIEGADLARESAR